MTAFFSASFSFMEIQPALRYFSSFEEQIVCLQEEILAQSGRKEQICRCLNELRQCGDILKEIPWAF